jgi:hypothetical protein
MERLLQGVRGILLLHDLFAKKVPHSLRPFRKPKVFGIWVLPCFDFSDLQIDPMKKEVVS